MFMKEEVLFESLPAKLPVGFIKNGVKLKNNIKNNVNHNNNNNNIVSKVAEMRSKASASVKYVHSKVTLYYSSRVELKWRRALHHCQTCEFGSNVKGESSICGAIHYGICTPVTVDQLLAALPHKVGRATTQSFRHAHTKTGPSHIGLPTGKHHSTSHVPSSHSSTVVVQVMFGSACFHCCCYCHSCLCGV